MFGRKQRRQAKDRAAQSARDGVSVLVFSVGQHHDREIVLRKVIQAAAVSHERSVLADAAMVGFLKTVFLKPVCLMIIFMIEDHGESVLRFGVLRGHMLRRAFSGGHLLESFWADEMLLLDGAPQLQKIAHGGAEAQVGVIGHVIFMGLNIVIPVPSPLYDTHGQGRG